MSDVKTAACARMPTVFIPHGAGPCFFMDWQPAGIWQPMESFLRSLGDTLPERPKAIILVSAHWLEHPVQVTAARQPELIYDYYGFPPHTYELTYPAPGAPELAAEVARLLTQAKIAVQQNPNRGFDHGTFIPLKLTYPEADIPVIQLSLDSSLDAQAHLEMGQALEPLRDQGVLILGSGMSFHNMRAYGDPRFYEPSLAFDQWLTEVTQSTPEQRYQALKQWDQAPSARLCHPPRAEEHLLPLMVIAGAASQGQGSKVFNDRVLDVEISAFRFD